MSGTSKPSSKGGDNRKVGAGCFVVALAGMIGFAACTTMGGFGSSGWDDAREAGINISRSHYDSLCRTMAGDRMPWDGGDEATWTREQGNELFDILTNDPDCQSDDG